jgi:hypothetical protein
MPGGWAGEQVSKGGQRDQVMDGPCSWAAQPTLPRVASAWAGAWGIYGHGVMGVCMDMEMGMDVGIWDMYGHGGMGTWDMHEHGGIGYAWTWQHAGMGYAWSWGILEHIKNMHYS